MYPKADPDSVLKYFHSRNIIAQNPFGSLHLVNFEINLYMALSIV